MYTRSVRYSCVHGRILKYLLRTPYLGTSTGYYPTYLLNLPVPRYYVIMYPNLPVQLSVVCTAVYVHAHSVIVAAAVSLFIYNLQNNTRGERESF